MKALISNFKASIQANGHQCIEVKDYEDFCTKLNCMGGSYKGFVMTTQLDNFCLFYIDTEIMRAKAYAEFNTLPDIRFTMSPEARKFAEAQPESFARKCINGQQMFEYMKTYEEEFESQKKEGIISKIKKYFTKNSSRHSIK